MKLINKSVLLLTAILVAVFSAHTLVVTSMYSESLSKLILTYGFNYTFTLIVLVVFQIFVNKDIKQLGTVFLFSSMIKFLLFFMLIWPFLKIEGAVKSFAFAAFFIPYAICLATEVLVTVRLLRKMDEKS